MTAQEMIEGLKKGFKYRTEHGEFTPDDRGNVYFNSYFLSHTFLDILLSEIGDRLIVEEPKPKVWLDSCGWGDVYCTGLKSRRVVCTPDMVPLIEKAVRELGGLS